MLHSKTFEFYILSIVQEFYDGFNKKSIDQDYGIIKVNWRGELKIMHLQPISELTGVPLGESEIQNPGNLGDYIHLIGDILNRLKEEGLVLNRCTEMCTIYVDCCTKMF